MRKQTILKFAIAFGIILGISSCKKKVQPSREVVENKEAIGVFNFLDEEGSATYKSLNLDESHPNLIDPRISKSDHAAVIASWSDLHQRIGKYLSENEFSWGVEDETISMLQKIYFEPDGKIKYYAFRVFNEDVTEEKQAEFANLISEFAKTNRIDFQQQKRFAQCGKTKYMNE